MRLKRLSIHNCRLIKAAEFSLSGGLNLFHGPNGSGKTSILESVAILSTGRSFRSPKIAGVIHHDASSLIIHAQCEAEQQTYQIGIEKSPQDTRIRVNHQDIHTQSELSRYLPVISIHPNSVELITGSPSLRRSFVDWICFYLFDEYHAQWLNYRRILKQRNLCLRLTEYRSALPVWTQELIAAQQRIHTFRLQALQTLQQAFEGFQRSLFGEMMITFQLSSGFPADVDSDNPQQQLEYYEQRRAQELKYCRTIAGAHRSDLLINMSGQPAKVCASRGQMKLIVIAMLLAQSKAIQKEDTVHSAIIQIDDMAAELDTHNKQQLMDILRELDQQLLLTTTNHQLFDLATDDKMFHVKHGEIVAS